jgi:hypothetical protein
MFVSTSKGYINIALVRLIEESDEAVRFIFDDQRGQFVTLPKKEGSRVVMTMFNELMISAD